MISKECPCGINKDTCDYHKQAVKIIYIKHKELPLPSWDLSSASAEDLKICFDELDKLPISVYDIMFDKIW
jgi:hypothetical protein